MDPYVDGDESTSDTPEGKGAVVKTSTRQTVFLPIPGLVRAHELKPGELVGTNKDSYIILEKLPAEFDSRVKAMEVDERPTEDYTDVGGLDKQIQELIEAVVLPMTQWEKFEAIGIRAPKGTELGDEMMLTRGRGASLRSAGDGEDVVGQSLCQELRRHFPEACSSPAGADVHRRRSEDGS